MLARRCIFESYPDERQIVAPFLVPTSPSSPPPPLEYVGFQRIGETISLVVPADPLCFQTTLWHLESAGEDTFERGEN